MNLLKDLSTKDFLNSYWEKKHILIKDAFSSIELDFDRDQLLGLALDEDVESRLVIQNNKDWELDYGPLSNLDFKDEQDKWTLFIHSLNLIESFSNQLEKLTRFIPQWLFDDVLCSVSTDGSTVGAHFDRYNVFILQVAGKRRWSIQEEPVKKFRKNSAIKVLEEFKADREYILSPGDMIFIPPECAHEGVSIGDSISLSIGFKSLEKAQILQSFMSELLEGLDDEAYIKTKPADFENSPYAISKEFISNLYEQTVSEIDFQKEFEKSLLKFLTTPKVSSPIENEEFTLDEFQSECENENLAFADEIRMINYEGSFWINEQKVSVAKNDISDLINFIDARDETFHLGDVPETLKGYIYQMYCLNLVGFISS